MAYRVKTASSYRIGQSVPDSTIPSHILGNAKRPVDANGILPEYDGSLFMYEMNGAFPYLYQASPQFSDWVNDPARNGNEAEKDFWRQIGRAEISRHFSFVHDSNTDVGIWYNNISDFSRSILRGMADSANAVVGELSSWPNFQVPSSVVQETIDYLKQWADVSSQAEQAISQANSLLQQQLTYANQVIAEGLRYADILHESYENEVKALRTKIKELEAEVLKLMDENNQLRAKLREQSSMMDNLLALIQAGGNAAGEVIDKIGDNASKIAAPLAFGGITAIVLYGALAFGAFFLLRKI